MRLPVPLLLVLACGPTRSEPEPPAPAPTAHAIAAPAPASPPPAPTAPALRITHLANEGVLLVAGDTAVLIDGLHRPYKPDYAVLGADDRHAVETATDAYAAVRLILVSHHHRDHFDAAAVRRHLEHNPQARLISSPQVTRAVLAGLRDEAVRARVETVPYHPGVRHTRSVGEIGVELLGLPHGTGVHRAVHNFGHVVELAGQRVIHVGDADLGDPEYLAFDLPSRRLTAAILPFWYFLSATDVITVERLFAADRYYAVHVDPRDPQIAATLARTAPDVVVLDVPFETPVTTSPP